ncbi:MAG: lysyl-tRNA synthetase, class [Patescibacteria group bacterium]|nr:lysyl-tRNA synthetase, class [Patescibacteria group bacterium]
MSALDEIRAEKLRKLKLLEAAGKNPYPNNARRTHEIGQILGGFNVLETEGGSIVADGRIRSIRTHGGSSFIDIDDGTGKMQLFLKKDEVGEEAFSLFIDTIDIGDFVEATGVPMRTKSGQESLLVSDWRILSKTLRPIPDEWYGFSDEDERFRRRYLDMLLNKEVLENAKKRSVFWNAFRTYLLSREFVEVETPVLENTTGGAEARPFVTHHNALNIDVYLRISAGELWQKMLLVGGLPKTFEIGRIFRNEGMSREHLQDYTQLEFYQAYSDYEEGMRMVTDMYRFVAQETFGTLEFTIGEHQVDLAKDWEVYDFCEVIQKEYGIDPLTVTLEEVKAALKKAGIEKDAESMSIGRGVDLLWKRIRKGISGPGFLIGVPVYLEPLAKRSEKNGEVVERFQIILAGSEMGKGFSELNNPIDQKDRFLAQQALRDAGDDEAQMADMDFVEALEYGMPPSFGFGLSERLFSFLMNKDVRETQLFPLMRPRD